MALLLELTADWLVSLVMWLGLTADWIVSVVMLLGLTADRLVSLGLWLELTTDWLVSLVLWLELTTDWLVSLVLWLELTADWLVSLSAVIGHWPLLTATRHLDLQTTEKETATTEDKKMGFVIAQLAAGSSRSQLLMQK